MDAVSTILEREDTQEAAEDSEGAHYTELGLSQLPGWDAPGAHVFEDPVLLREMAKNAAKWARENGLARENPIHGKEEFKIVVRDSFRFSQRQRTTTRATATTTLQARCNHESLHLCQNAGGIFETAANENTANNLLMSRPQMGLTSLFFVFIFDRYLRRGQVSTGMPPAAAAGGGKKKDRFPILQQGQNPIGSFERELLVITRLH